MRIVMGIVLMVLTTILFTGCQTTKPIAEVTTALATDPAIKDGDVLKKRRDSGEDIPALRGTNVLTVRAFHHIKTKSNTGFRYKKEELVGAQCKAQSDGFTASVRTPGQIRVPDYGYASRMVSVSCTKDGFKQSFAQARAFDEKKASRSQSGASNGLAGLVVAEIINSMDDEKNNKFVYHPANVYMNKVGCENTKRGCRAR